MKDGATFFLDGVVDIQVLFRLVSTLDTFVFAEISLLVDLEGVTKVYLIKKTTHPFARASRVRKKSVNPRIVKAKMRLHGN